MDSALKEAIQRVVSDLQEPFYIFDERAIEQAIKNFCHSFEARSLKIEIAYSIKTNSNRHIVGFLRELGAWGEATCLEEIELARNSGFKQVLFNGILKTEKEIELASALDAVIVLDGIKQFNDTKNVADKLGKKFRVGVRVSSYPVMSDAGTRFGLYSDSSELKGLIESLAQSEKLDLQFLHMHLGTNIFDCKKYSQALVTLIKVEELANQYGHKIDSLDIGGGLPGTIDDQWLGSFSDNFVKILRSSHNQKKLVIEPGRSLVEQSGYLVTKVVDVRSREEMVGKDIILNAGTNCLLGQKYGSSYQCLALNTQPERAEADLRLVGPLCHSDDIIQDPYTGPSVESGDTLIISGVGAYDFSTSFEFGRKKPSVFAFNLSGSVEDITEW